MLLSHVCCGLCVLDMSAEMAYGDALAVLVPQHRTEKSGSDSMICISSMFFCFGVWLFMYMCAYIYIYCIYIHTQSSDISELVSLTFP